MRPLSLSGGPPRNDVQAQLQWIMSAIRQIELASNEADVTIIAKNFAISGSFTPTRTLDAGSPTLANVVAVLATIIQDLQKGGANRTT